MTPSIDFAAHEWNDWRWQLKHAARSVNDLIALGLISSEDSAYSDQLATRYKTLISPYYLSLIDPHNPQCPIRKQALPSIEELKDVKGELSDPIGDQIYSPTPIIVHRYPDRALLFPTFECPMYCRYCFRKETLNDSSIRLHQALPDALKYINNHPQIQEVILSGGDPLMLSDDKLKRLMIQVINAGVRRIRIHSRMVVTLPQRITHNLGSIFEELSSEVHLMMVTHFNHPKELTEDSCHALKTMRDSGVSLLNQSVLLKGVNDHVHTLKKLSHQLINNSVFPYYLHHPDLTKGTQHFRLSISEGLQLYKKLRGQISGYLIPRYVIEIPRGGGKVEVDSSAVQKGDKYGEWWLESPLTGERYPYIDLTHLNSNDCPEGESHDS